jgi:hypothetical protein
MEDQTQIESADTTEINGLRITVNEETSEITFDWDPETHPQYNYIYEIGEAELLKKLTESMKDLIKECEEQAAGEGK